MNNFRSHGFGNRHFPTHRCIPAQRLLPLHYGSQPAAWQWTNRLSMRRLVTWRTPSFLRPLRLGWNSLLHWFRGRS